MLKVNNLVEDSILKLANNQATQIDWEVVYYGYYIYLTNDEMKENLGKLLINSSVDIENDKINILKNVIKDNLGITKVKK